MVGCVMRGELSAAAANCPMSAGAEVPTGVSGSAPREAMPVGCDLVGVRSAVAAGSADRFETYFPDWHAMTCTPRPVIRQQRQPPATAGQLGSPMAAPPPHPGQTSQGPAPALLPQS